MPTGFQQANPLLAVGQNCVVSNLSETAIHEHFAPGHKAAFFRSQEQWILA
ncbi:hypothetical protein SAMN05444743_105141 [Pseudomonas sp. PDC86]|jgi:hypothetical protein|uniref:Uncharacterized protein n=1 Tax=Pseudomonas gorinensis TaxID=3240790 RepID=A0ACA7P6X8_9PSED|nr:hypothetical protein U771_15950 [Pseudomonas sp. TKP]SDY76763.1 hypothetical protein SAMN05444743_105141 [Pseudomonas sp. PDC86]